MCCITRRILGSCWIHQSAILLSLVVLYYDHLLTLSSEVTFIWRARFSLAKALFVANRYLAFLANIVCNLSTSFHQASIIVSQVIVCLVLVLRTHALYGQSRRILLLIFGVGFVLLAIISWSLFNQESTKAIAPGCLNGATTTTGRRLAYAWEALLVFDTLIFGLTLKIALSRGPSSLRLKDVSRMMALILWDGSMYFALMALVNFANILTFYLAPPILKGVLSTFANTFSVTLVSRLMLHLHQFANSGRQSVFESSCATYPNDPWPPRAVIFSEGSKTFGPV
ncbi:hypothetical protein NEOLEDRAFT_964962 [Neolentinus lepideus HHB14362 ss-1]|uniref:DUF6533 domain-containing protein n=1 Tax=Neolentinus lepideus HHB14362 ss-1 TaxID=1314782 RepID=A0A165UHR4_9AGAM|nr:hypothetical protein NEOLEDRAFT_964962 [Neolentinus lepideus HHB14362 ss-1]